MILQLPLLSTVIRLTWPMVLLLVMIMACGLLLGPIPCLVGLSLLVMVPSLLLASILLMPTSGLLDPPSVVTLILPPNHLIAGPATTLVNLQSKRFWRDLNLLFLYISLSRG